MKPVLILLLIIFTLTVCMAQETQAPSADGNAAAATKLHQEFLDNAKSTNSEENARKKRESDRALVEATKVKNAKMRSLSASQAYIWSASKDKSDALLDRLVAASEAERKESKIFGLSKFWLIRILAFIGVLVVCGIFYCFERKIKKS